jgi:spermidine synthase
MPLQSSDASHVRRVAGQVLPLLTVLFVGSGCAALIYEIVWFQMLQFVIGSSAVSLGVLLGTFMGGMCLGSLLLPHWISPRAHPLRVYAALELGIGLIGVIVLFAMPLVGSLYSAWVGHGLAGYLLRGAVAAVCLLPPTLLMGATLPAIARSVDATPHGVSWLGFFYGGNIAGAVGGCLLAGFYLLRVHDMATATYVAAAINVAVTLMALLLALRTPQAASGAAEYEKGANPLTPGRPAGHGVGPAYVAIGLSGLTALGAEVIWTRLLSLLLGGTVYTFSIILAVFLVGLGIGSSIGSWFGRTSARPGVALGACQMLLAAAIAWAAWQLSRSLPYWPIKPNLSLSPWFNLQLDLVRCLWAILPAACLWGASFPLALAAVASPGQDPGRIVGRVYAANTVGAIVGALAFSIVFIGWIGTQQSQRLLMLLAALAGLVVLLPLAWRKAGASVWGAARPLSRRVAGALAVLCAAGLVAWLARAVPEVSSDLIAYGRNIPSETGKATVLYQGEGMNSSVAVTVLFDGTRNFHVSGKVEASSEPQDMRLQRMLGHIPALLHPQPRSVLVVGCGAGVTAGSFVVHPEVERIVICEIEPLIPREVVTYFSNENYNVVNDPRVEIEYDDARHFVLTTRETFDIITSDPIHPWVKGAATLYTKEYFELCRRRLKPGGMITQWVPLYESNPDAVKSELATLFSVFPEASVWGNAAAGRGYDVVVLAQTEPLRINVEELIERLSRLDHYDVALSLRGVGFQSALDLLGNFAGQAADLTPWLVDAEINHDRNLRLQYLAGLGLNKYREAEIYEAMLAHRKYPEAVFIASDRSRRELLRRLSDVKPAD